MPIPEPNWTEAELALRVAWELDPATRSRFGTLDKAMNNPAVAAALRLSGAAWLRKRQKEQNHGQSQNH